MGFIDPQWLAEILKANVWKCAAFTAAAAVIAFGHLIGLTQLRELPEVVQPIALAVMIIFGALTVFGIAENAAPLVKGAVTRRRAARAWRAEANKMIAMLDNPSEDERAILSYLVTTGQQYFTCDIDGDRARTLIAKGIVVLATRPGQVFDHEHTPFKVRDEIWQVLLTRPDEFKHPKPAGPHPWRTPWMAR